MAKICNDCGNMCADNAVKCDVCGKEFTNRQASQPGYAQGSYSQSSYSQPSYSQPSYSQSGYSSPYSAQSFGTADSTPMIAKKSGNKTAALILALIIIAVVTFVMVILPMIKPRPYEKGLDKFFTALENRDSKAVMEVLYLQPLLDAVKNEYPNQAYFLEQTAYSGFGEGLFGSIEEEVGEDYKVKYKIIDSEKLDENEFSDIEDNYKNLFGTFSNIGVKPPVVESAYRVELEWSYETDDNKYDTDAEFILFEVDDEWYISFLDS